MSRSDRQPVPDPALPVVAIAGRPNVGKSALFNRLAGRRIAIVHAESGVTRDGVAALAEWDGRPFELVDTGGLQAAGRTLSGDAMEEAVRRQTDAALDEADAILFVVDVEQGATGLDQEVAAHLHRGGKPVFVACNKCDTEARDSASAACAVFGFPVFPVSALHNRGIGDLMEAVCGALPAAEWLAADRPAATGDTPIRVVLAGRPNVGKSSLANALADRERVIVSDRPGTTRDSIDIAVAAGSGEALRRYVVTDTAGIRRAGKADTAVEKFSLIRAEESIRQADVAVLLLDAQQGPTEQDKKIAALIQAHDRGCVVVVNKWDLARGKVKERAYAEALRRAVPFLDPAPLLFVSARTWYPVRALPDAIDRVAAAVRRTLSTGRLNRAVREACERTPPPAVRGRRLKLYYAAQVGVDPVRLALFVNDPRLWAPAYESYLIKAIRARFDLTGAPVRLKIRARRAAEPGAADDTQALKRGGHSV